MKYIYFALASFLFVACSSKEMKETEATEETVAEIEAAQMMARDAARDFVSKQWDDTLQLQGDLMQVRSVQSKFVMEGKKRCAEAFDSTFVSTLNTVRPELAAHLKYDAIR